MSAPERWRSPDGDRNAQALQEAHPALYDAIAGFDALGHRVLARVETGPTITQDRELVAIALLRRGVTLFAGFRCLAEGSSIEPAKLVVRALLETFFATLHLVHGGPVPLQPNLTADVVAAQEKRARYFRTLAVRRAIYRRQALLDGALGSTPPVSAEQRAGIEAEIAERRTLLQGAFAAENADVGPLRCDAQSSKKQYHDGPASWYSFGPGAHARSVRQLAVALGYLPVYEMLYDALSALVHPRDYTQDVEVVNGHAHVLHPHNPDALSLLTKWAVLAARGIILTYCWAFQQASIDDVRETSVRFQPAIDAAPAAIPASFL